ncbi:MAG: MFS transporter [Jatrophihabitans sp.]
MNALTAVVRDRRALELLGVLALRRVAGAGFPIVLVVATAEVRGFAAAALVQGFRVAALALTAPFRARLLDRIGRSRVVLPQTVITAIALSCLVVCSISGRLPIWTAAASAVIMALSSPSLDAVIRTVWRTIATTDAEVKALHSYDSILEEAGFLVGPFLASVLMLGLGPRSALYVVAAAVIAGSVLTLLPSEIRAALRQQVAKATPPATTTGAGRLDKVRRALRTAAGPIATPELQRIVAPLILMGVELGIVGILAPALSQAHGRAANSGFVIACISLGGIIGAFTYGSVNLGPSLRRRHAVLGVIFGTPLVMGAWAHSPWQLGLLLGVAGLAVTPLYINAYLMMDADIPRSAIHEANTWVPVGNDVGYIIGLAVAGWLSGHNELHAISVSLSAAALLLVAYSLYQLRTPSPAAAASENLAMPASSP